MVVMEDRMCRRQGKFFGCQASFLSNWNLGRLIGSGTDLPHH